MKKSSAIGIALAALTAFAGATLSSVARADEGTIAMTIYKAGWVIGGSGGSGTLNFRGRRYALSTGGLDYGLVFAARRRCCAAASATSTARPTSLASMARRARALRSAAARARSC